MALDVPVSDVIAVFGDAPMGYHELRQALYECKFMYVELVSPSLVITGWYFVVVPSLNNRGGTHQMLIYYDLDRGIRQVLDPSRGNRYAEDGSDFHSWTELIFFHPGGRLPKRKHEST